MNIFRKIIRHRRRKCDLLCSLISLNCCPRQVTVQEALCVTCITSLPPELVSLDPVWSIPLQTSLAVRAVPLCQSGTYHLLIDFSQGLDLYAYLLTGSPTVISSSLVRNMTCTKEI